MKFDVVLGNPPFQAIKEDGERKDQASNLWVEFWFKSLEISNSKIALITPTSWLSPSSDAKGKERLWDMFERYSTTADVDNVKSHFNVGSSFGYVIVDKTSSHGLQFVGREKSDLGFMPVSGFEETIENLTNNPSISIAQFDCNQSNSTLKRVAIPLTRKVSEESVQILEGECEPRGAKPGLFLYVYAGEECDLIRNRAVECKDIINTHCRWSGFANIKVIKMIKVEKSC